MALRIAVRTRSPPFLAAPFFGFGLLAPSICGLTPPNTVWRPPDWDLPSWQCAQSIYRGRTSLNNNSPVSNTLPSISFHFCFLRRPSLESLSTSLADPG
ncbi:hypothetical protein BJX63DRAFT_415977 [Aspergillus granulosus]|uniref:Secreted protein n=1 Tax=Aspergillus granulosus TaxID=176169 RepID=A0ABR4GSL7_9EURO